MELHTPFNYASSEAPQAENIHPSSGSLQFCPPAFLNRPEFAGSHYPDGPDVGLALGFNVDHFIAADQVVSGCPQSASHFARPSADRPGLTCLNDLSAEHCYSALGIFRKVRQMGNKIIEGLKPALCRG